MANENVLSQDEINALLHGVENGRIDTEDAYRLRDGVARPVDLTAHERIVRGRMPTLEMINNRFCRNLRVSLFNFLQRAVNVTFSGVKLRKFAEHIHTLTLPTSLNMVRMSPLRGHALFILDSKLVFSLVETYFGGGGRFSTRMDAREFTAMENRVINLTLERCFADMRDAWSPVLGVEFEYVNSEVNPQFANIVSPTELVVVSTFALDIDDIGGELHVTLPYAMLEPIRELLDAGVQSDRDARDDRWTTSIRAEMGTAEVELHATLLETQLSLRKLLELKAGDIVPVELPEEVTLCAEGVPIFRGNFGVSNGNNAIKVLRRVADTAKLAAEAAAPARRHGVRDE
ncbi:MAG TPA: flagellar motor switch protein FliM [Gammaproteobacteria bacterium]|nr:flagellar motor switch protein FliM [Gammaproteobacteria bacterium]